MKKLIIKIVIILFIFLFYKGLKSRITEKYYMNTTVGYYNVTDKILKDSYKWVDENRLINPDPMKFDYNELLLIKETLYTFAIKNYPDLPENILKKIKDITIEEIKKIPYIFTGYLHCFDEDVYLFNIESNNKSYNVYVIKYKTMEGVYKDGELIDYKLVKKIRFENEKWYRNFYETEDEYNKNKYSIQKTSTPLFLVDESSNPSPKRLWKILK